MGIDKIYSDFASVDCIKFIGDQNKGELKSAKREFDKSSNKDLKKNPNTADNTIRPPFIFAVSRIHVSKEPVFVVCKHV